MRNWSVREVVIVACAATWCLGWLLVMVGETVRGQRPAAEELSAFALGAAAIITQLNPRGRKGGDDE